MKVTLVFALVLSLSAIVSVRFVQNDLENNSLGELQKLYDKRVDIGPVVSGRLKLDSDKLSLVNDIHSGLFDIYKLLEARRYRQRHEVSRLLDLTSSIDIDDKSGSATDALNVKAKDFQETLNASGVKSIVKEPCLDILENVISDTYKLSQLTKGRSKTTERADSAGFLDSEFSSVVELWANKLKNTHNWLYYSLLIFTLTFIFLFISAAIALFQRKSSDRRWELMFEKSQHVLDNLKLRTESPLVVISNSGSILWSNSIFDTIFSLSKALHSEEDILKKIVSKTSDTGVDDVVQIDGVVNSDFILKKQIDSTSGTTTYSFFPLKSYYREYLEGKKGDSCYMELGEGVFVLQSLLDESIIEHTSSGTPIAIELVDGKLPIIVHGEEDRYTKFISSLLSVSSILASKTSDKKVLISFEKNGEDIKILFEVSGGVVEDKLLKESYGGVEICDIFGQIEAENADLSAKVSLKNARYADESRSANIEISFTRAAKSVNLAKDSARCIM